MKNKQKVLFTFLIILFIMLSSVPLIVALLFGIKPNETEFSIGILSIFFSALSFIGIIITIWHQISNGQQQQEEINRNFQLAKDGYNLQLLNHIESLFLSDKFQDCRFRVWSFWTDYNTNEDVKKEMEKIFEDSIYDFWCDNRDKAEELFKTERFNDFKEIIRFMRYFDLISRFTFDKVTINAIHFYYTYYRNFFLTISSIYKEKYDYVVTNNKKISQTLQGWSNIVERMDNLLYSYNLPINSLDIKEEENITKVST